MYPQGPSAHPPPPLKHVQRMSVLQSLNTINASTSLISLQCCTKLNNNLTEFQLTEGKGVEERAGHYSYSVTRMSCPTESKVGSIAACFFLGRPQALCPRLLKPLSNTPICFYWSLTNQGQFLMLWRMNFLGKPLQHIGREYINTFWLAYIAKFSPRILRGRKPVVSTESLLGPEPWNVIFPPTHLIHSLFTAGLNSTLG